jgi:hypothetical protein
MPPKNIAAAAFRYSSCMRAHGLGNFPDPQVSSSPGQQSIKQMVPSSLVNSPQFRVAQQACRSIMPGPGDTSPAQLAQQQQTRERDLLAFAKCLRSRGLRRFPDPTSEGRLTLAMIHAAGVDLQAPDVLPAAKACIGVTHGLVTGADVERAISSPQ